MDINEIHKVLLKFEKRAENKPDDIITSTFVDAEPLLNILQAPLNQVIFGRRGTGKTHALKYCLSSKKEDGELAVYLDIRSIGSNGSYYADDSVDKVERGLRLVNDILVALLDELYPFAIKRIDEGYNAQQITLRIDDLTEAIGRVRLTGSLEVEKEEVTTQRDESHTGLAASVTPSSGKVSAMLNNDKATELRAAKSTRQAGKEKRIIDFSNTQVALDGLLKILGVSRMWLFLDEWSETPRSVQPYLADLLRKTIMPLGLVVVKIAAIEQRSSFVIPGEKGQYVGLELGADIGVELNLDEFLVFDYDEEKALRFFRELLFKNFNALSDATAPASSAAAFTNLIFTEKRAIEEFTRAVEGVPRDALNLTSRIVTKAFGRKAGVDDVRRAALDWYTQDKANVVSSSPELQNALNYIVDEVIGNRRARAFLFPSNVRHEVIDLLYDARVLHLLKKNVSSREEPGKRFDVWKIDYGCYVDLIKTQKSPMGLLPSDDKDVFFEVPSDDYRSIRRAVLTPDELDNFIS